MYNDRLETYNVEKISDQKTVTFSPNFHVMSTTRHTQYPQSHESYFDYHSNANSHIGMTQYS